MRGGAVADVMGAASILSSMLHLGSGGPSPLAAIGVPSDATAAERNALAAAASHAGAIVGAFVPEPLAAAVGAGVDLQSARPTVVVDLGEGVSDVAMIQSSNIIASAALRKGCADLRRALRDWFDLGHGVPVDDATAESLVRACCASVTPIERNVRLRYGRRRIVVRFEDVATVIDPVVDEIAHFVAVTLQSWGEPTPSSLLTGGGSKLLRLTARTAAYIGVEPSRARYPDLDVVRGLREMIRSRGLLHGVGEALAIN